MLEGEEQTEQLDASVSVSVLSWGETSREIESAMLRFGMQRRRLESRWRGLRVVLSVRAQGEARRIDALANFLDELRSQRGARVEITRASVYDEPSGAFRVGLPVKVP